MAPLAAAPPPAVTSIRDLGDCFVASVYVDGQPVPVYKVEHPSSIKTTCYIEAQEGKEFKVVLTCNELYGRALTAWLYLDGEQSGGQTIQHISSTITFKDKRVSASAVRPFVFGKLQTTDDADLATADENAVKNLGAISVALNRVQVLGTTVSGGSYGVTQQRVFDERSKKATLSHQASYGAEQSSVDSGVRTKVRYIDPFGSPFKELEFKYRSRALLELDGIVEPEPAAAAEASPPPAPAASSSSSNKKRQAISLSPDDDDTDLRAKVAKLEAENAALKRVKAEPGVKREPVANGSKVKAEKIVIDLCDDSD